MIKEFRKKIVPRLGPTAVDHLQRLHNLFGQCLQGAVATKYTAVLDKFPVATYTNTNFKEAQKAYLKKITEVTNLRDMLIRQLQNNGKPAHMQFNTYVACRQEWVCHLDSRYLNITIAMLTDQENVKAIFSHQSKRHQAKYALEKEEVKNNLENLRVFLMVVTQLMKLMAPTLRSSRASVTPSVLVTGRNPANKTTVPRELTRTVVSHPMGTTMQ
eukprot:7242566-Ditylum_brightwellii.AAC.1